ncbi:hypothetical protein J4E80_010329 [Alternaria sp. BMP 0032]|nr:hypothetical protein J4E80_010329 [Alternaria sp. BMP 0032]
MKASSSMLAVLFAATAASSPNTAPDCGCGKSLPKGVELDKSVDLTLESESGVSPRKYRLHIPPSYDNNNPVPLILSFHGRGKNAKYQEALSQFSNASYGFEGIVAYPEGVPNSKGTQQYQGDPDSPPSISDVKFTLELLDYLQSSYCIDSTRIYATGKSNGGGFTGGVLACDAKASSRIAAFAPVSGAFYLDADQQPLPCNPSRQVPMMEFHGLEDTTIPYAGGINTRGNANSTDVPTWVRDWVERDGLDVNANKTSYLCEGDNGKKVTRYSWDDLVVHYKYENLGHDWPSSFANGDTGDDEGVLTCREAEATRIMLDWFGGLVL